jgi:hypothetical protein
MSVAFGLWGGYGFIYVPHAAGVIHPALARILNAYDPDYLVEARYTHGDFEAMEPGGHARHYTNWPTETDESAWYLATLVDQDVPVPVDDNLGANFCSPFYEH